MRRALLSVVSIVLAVSVLLFGCNNAEEAEVPKKTEDVQRSNSNSALNRENLRPPPSPPGLNAGGGSDSELIKTGEHTSSDVFMNSDGEIICPVMQIVIESPEVAEGSTTVDGITYYFSTKEAQELFEEDPSAYIE